MDLKITVAIFSLVGVIIGGLINTGTTILLDRTRERVNRQRESRKYAVELKRASRLIDAELSRAQAAAQICVEKKHWWSQDIQPLTTEAWQKFSGIVAPELSDTAWLAVRVAVEAVDNLRSARGIAVELGLTTEAIPNTTAEKIVPMLRDIEAGRRALAPFMLDALYAPGDSTKIEPR
jgi:hypothetical protein